MRRIAYFGRGFALAGLWILTWALCTYLSTDLPAPRAAPSAEEWRTALAKSSWFDRSRYGINHAFLRGSAFERGLAWGRLSGDRLYRQEKNLIDLYKALIPSPFARKFFELAVMRIFHGIDRVIEPAMLSEMWGVAQSADRVFNDYASPFARQVAYHGIHEVGQLFVDFAPASFACTFVGLPLGGAATPNWLVGRTFDFEGGRIFDEEKVIKWVTPEHGYKFVSVIWTGMVGAVTGVNEHGLLVSINAAGSNDLSFSGLPSTLLVTKVLQEAANFDEALRIFRDTPVMITDIFMLLDSKNQRLFKIEKSSRRFAVEEITQARAVTNHLEAPIFATDPFNRFRREKLTSSYRLARAQELVGALARRLPVSKAVGLDGLLAILRDKGRDAQGHPLHLGNRRAVDALIASHAAVFDSARQILYVTEGPALVGKLRGYDIAASFAAGRPVEVASLPADPAVTPEIYRDYAQKVQQLRVAMSILKHNDCAGARAVLTPLANFAHVDTQIAFWKLAECEHDPAAAQVAIRRALALQPPYVATERALREALK